MSPHRPLPFVPGVKRRVQLMATCLCDAFYDDVARATVEVLEHLGCAVEFPEGQTCCGQPAFNGGDWPASRQVVRHTLTTFAGECPVLVPSGSCAAMLRHGTELEFEKEPDLPAVQALAERTWEFADFLVNALGVTSWPGHYKATVVFHRNCHNRGTNSEAAALKLLGLVSGLRVIPFGEPEQCCGFGGTFAVGFPNLSTGIGRLKLDYLRAVNPDLVVSGDMSCLMHLGGLAERDGRRIVIRHLAQVLRDSFRQGEKRE